MAAEYFVVLAGAEEGKLLTKLADYRAVGGFEACQIPLASRVPPTTLR